MASLALLSFRLTGVDGVSIEAAKWVSAFEALGHEVRLVAGSGDERVTKIPGLDLGDPTGVDEHALVDALHDVDVVIVDNLLSLPINRSASEAVARALRGRPAIIRHHDLATDRPDTDSWWPPPTDEAWRHVAISPPVAEALGDVGISATLVWNHFDLTPPLFSRHKARDHFDIDLSTTVFLQPTRAIPRKNIPQAIAIAQWCHATYWLTGPAEDGYQSELDQILADARIPIRRGIDPDPISMAYAACDVVLLPSTREGFGNPIVESIAQDRPLVLGHFPVAQCLRDLGFRFLDAHNPEQVAAWLARPDSSMFEANRALAAPLFDITALPEKLAAVLAPFGL
jgi:mannosylglucosylglycerate synthase